MAEDRRIFSFDKLPLISASEHLERNTSTSSTSLNIAVCTVLSHTTRGGAPKAVVCSWVYNRCEQFHSVPRQETREHWVLRGWTLGCWETSLLSPREKSFTFACPYISPLISSPPPVATPPSCFFHSRSHMAALDSSDTVSLLGPAPSTGHL